MSLLTTVNGRGTLAARPAAAAANEGYIYSASDASLYRSNGTSWDTIASSSTGLADMGTATYLDYTTAAAPANPAAGKIRVYSKTGDTFAQKTSAGVETVFGAGGGGAGDASVRFYSYDDGTSAVVGTWALVATTTAPLYGSQIWGNSTAAVNDAMEWTRFLQAGTYTVQVRGVTNTDKPIVTVKIDGVSVGTVDYYTAALGYLRTQIAGAVIASSGSHTIQVVMATKNASSTGYGMAFSDILLYRTA